MTQPARQQEVFAADLVAEAVLPLEVWVHNGTERRIRIKPENFKLALPNDDLIAPASGAEAAWLAAPKWR